MTKKVCLIIETPLDRRDYERFGIQILKNRGFKINIIDLTNLFNPEYLKRYNPPDIFEYENIIQIKTLGELEEVIKNNIDAVYIDLARIYYKGFAMYKLMKKYKIKYVAFFANCIPFSFNIEKKDLSAIKYLRAISKKIKTINLRKIKYKWQNFLLFIRKTKIQLPEKVFLGGEKSENQLGMIEKNAKKIWLHSFDYDLYLKSREDKHDIKEKYAVFLDEYYPFHPDLMLYGLPMPFIDTKKYYDNIVKLFEYVENATGMKVVIAAHPRSKYNEHPEYFGKREVIKYKTVDLVRDSQLVLAHSSTSINFAALFKKPIIFSTTNDLKKSIFGEIIDSYAEQFSKVAHNLDNALSIIIEEEKIVNDELYDGYIKNYIKMPNTPEKNFWEIAADEIEKIA